MCGGPGCGWGVGCHCPPVRNDIVTPRQLLFLFVASLPKASGFVEVLNIDEVDDGGVKCQWLRGSYQMEGTVEGESCMLGLS